MWRPSCVPESQSGGAPDHPVVERVRPRSTLTHADREGDGGDGQEWEGVAKLKEDYEELFGYYIEY